MAPNPVFERPPGGRVLSVKGYGARSRTGKALFTFTLDSFANTLLSGLRMFMRYMMGY